MNVQRESHPGHLGVYRISCGSTVAFLAIHRYVEGRAFGGIRIRPYPDEASARQDALNLAAGMSRKLAIAGIPGGGAKTVMIAPTQRRQEAVRDLGRFIESLEGQYCCGPDLGFTAADNTVLRTTTAHVASGDLAVATARGLVLALHAVTSPKTVLVQGLGAVGRPFADRLHADGVRVLVNDLRSIPGAKHFKRVAPEAVYTTPCDVFAPCALGGQITAEVIARLPARVVCGAANNILAEPARGARQLAARGIVYVPDFVANIGATLEGASRALGQADQIEPRFQAHAQRVRALISQAQRENRTPYDIAIGWADGQEQPAGANND